MKQINLNKNKMKKLFKILQKKIKNNKKKLFFNLIIVYKIMNKNKIVIKICKKQFCNLNKIQKI